MAVIELDQLLSPLSEDQPCGEDLEYDPAFIELENASKGAPEQQMGDTIVAAEEPNWKVVRSLALDLFGRTRDLRVAAYLTRALANEDGFPGLRDGLALIKQLCEQHWDHVHPLLDPDDDNDPTMRVNTLESLSDDETIIPEIRKIPLVSLQGVGRFSLRSIEIAKGEIHPTEQEEADGLPELALIEGAFSDCELEDLQATTDAITESIEQALGIESAVIGFVGATEGPNLGELQSVLKEVQPVLAEQLAARGVAVEGMEGAAAGDAGAAGQPVSGEISSNADVNRMLDKICEYFKRNEPSSPVPLLLQRAKRLVAKDYMEILQDLTPDAVSQARMITGAEDESDSY
jgi:type VI secretion system protein ImpA